jgi:hypothetical protein
MDLAHEFNVSYEQLERVSSLARMCYELSRGFVWHEFRHYAGAAPGVWLLWVAQRDDDGGDIATCYLPHQACS